MYFKTRTKSVFKNKEEMSAVKALLDCANTTAFRPPEIKKKRENEGLCPWGGNKKEPTTLIPKLIAHIRPLNLLKHHIKRSFRIK